MNFDKVTAYMDNLEKDYEVHGADCIVMKDHKVVYRHMVGFSDYEMTKPVDGSEIYDIYSASKVATMVAVMQLVEQGKIGLEDPVSKYLPEYGQMYYDPNFKLGQWPFAWPTKESDLLPAKNPILIWHLMSMTAGLSYDTTAEPIKKLAEETNGEATTREMVRAIAQLPLLYEPGTRYAYSLAHDVLAGVVEVVSGMTFGEYMQKNVYGPLDIKDTWYQIPEQEKGRLFAQYAVDFRTGKMVRQEGNGFRLSKKYESGGAGVTTAAGEYVKLMDALACGGVGATGNRILTEESVKAIGTNRMGDVQLKDFQMSGKVGYGYGLGVRVLIDQSVSKSPVGEFGWDGAAGAYALIDPFSHISVYYAQQVLGMMKVYTEIHPALRDLIYEGFSR